MEAIPKDADEYPYLVVDKAKLLKEQEGKTYDMKKSCWVPDEKLGFIAGEVESTKGDDIMVKTVKGDTVTVKKDAYMERNPFKYEKSEDMANLSFLSEAAVLHNLRERYQAMMIYTYSGLFCVVVNPYKRLPIYTDQVIQRYRGKRRNEMPPHLFAIADGAFSFMLQDRENQSILITGESGAGKTENTKKVIMYFAKVAAAQQAAALAAGETQEEEGKSSLEEQIVQCNPPLEAYGNAKTVRNNNSSRFGKFIRIHFGAQGKIAGADIEHYLLEKSRVCSQMKLERGYHIFFQLCSNGRPEYQEKLLIPPDPSGFAFINQGTLKVDNIDDDFEMKETDKAFDTLGFTKDEKLSLFKCTAAVMHMGQMKFKGKDDSAEPDGTADAEKVAFLLGVAAGDLLKALCKPKVKVGNEWVQKGQTVQQVLYATATLAKSLYTRFFDWLVKRCNQTLDTKQRRQYFIGVLDIAGFEIFEYNSFDQLCINYTNERLQQFFNHHMFVLEQEEYKREGIDWVFIDFGMDLQACIELIEKPMGILSILEEECMFPKASDKSLVDKLYTNHLGKSPNFTKPKPQKGGGLENHFELGHYAGVVAYGCTGWLEKNKDPVNASVVELMSRSKDALVAILFPPPDPDDGGGGKKKKKGGAMGTISSAHRESLNRLMKNLYSTHPHFVRCLIPNENKEPGAIDAHLVLHQLQCNGVLEGIRICRKGFPNRIIYPDFKQRYTILAPNSVPQGFVDAKVVAEKVLGALAMDNNEYKLGQTKVFFKAGVLARLEEMREERLAHILSYFQAYVRGYLNRRQYKKLWDQRTALALIQRNIRKYMGMKDWQWWKFYTMIKPLLSQMHSEDEIKKREEEFQKQAEELVRMEKLAKELEEQNVMISKQKDDLFIENSTMQDKISEYEDRVENFMKERQDAEQSLKEAESRQAETEQRLASIESQKHKMSDENASLNKEKTELQGHLAKAEQEKTNKDNQIRKIQDELALQDQNYTKLQREKKQLDEKNNKTLADLAAEEDKVNHLRKVEQKLKSSLDEMEDSLGREKKIRGDVEKAKRKLETDLKMSQDACMELENQKRELEETGRRKDNEMSQLNSRIEEEQSKVAGLLKKIKELQRRIEELEEELEMERALRSKTEKQRNDLQHELDDMSSRLDEAGGVSNAQAELNKRREQELVKLRQEMNENQMQNESALATLRKKGDDAINELSEQLDQAQKTKSRLEKERTAFRQEVEDLTMQVDYANKARSNTDKNVKVLESKNSELQSKLDEFARNNNDLSQQRARANQETADASKQLEDAESQLAALTRAKQQLVSALDEAKRNADEESRLKNKATAELRNALADLEKAREMAEEEAEGKSLVQRQLARANQEMAAIRAKLAGAGDGEMSDEMKHRFQVKMAEMEQMLENSNSKVAQLEKVKMRLQSEVDDLSFEVERSQALASQAEKKQRQIDRIVSEYQEKIAVLNSDLEASGRDARAFSAEVFRLKALYEEATDVQDGLRRENKNLSEEIRELMDQLSEGGRSVHEVEKARKRLELEKQELQAALEEAEAALEGEESKVQRAQLELAQYRQDIDRRCAEKDEELEIARKNHQRAMEAMQSSLEVETRSKVEAQRARKKMEQDVNELEMTLDTTSRQKAELEKTVKRIQVQIIEIQQKCDEETRAKEEMRDMVMVAERRAAQIHGEFDELRGQIESLERARKHADMEANDAINRCNELQLQCNSLGSSKRKLDSDLQAMATDLDDAINELKGSEERCKKSMAESARMSEEIRHEQDHSNHLEKLRKNLESQVRELQVRVDEAEAQALKGGKRQIAKLEQRARELEGELDAEQRAHGESQKCARRAEQKCREYLASVEDERRNQERLSDICDKVNQKLKMYKRQVEEAEEIAAINLAKYRKMQSELEEAVERAEAAESQVTRYRIQSRRGTSVGPGATSVVRTTYSTERTT